MNWRQKVTGEGLELLKQPKPPVGQVSCWKGLAFPLIWGSVEVDNPGPESRIVGTASSAAMA
jgi:hypothetical protein